MSERRRMMMQQSVKYEKLTVFVTTNTGSLTSYISICDREGEILSSQTVNSSSSATFEIPYGTEYVIKAYSDGDDNYSVEYYDSNYVANQLTRSVTIRYNISLVWVPVYTMNNTSTGDLLGYGEFNKIVTYGYNCVYGIKGCSVYYNYMYSNTIDKYISFSNGYKFRYYRSNTNYLYGYVYNGNTRITTAASDGWWTLETSTPTSTTDTVSYFGNPYTCFKVKISKKMFNTITGRTWSNN